MTSFEIIKNGNSDIFLLEKVNCSSKDELKARERHHIESLNCANKNNPGKNIMKLTKKKFDNTNKKIKKRFSNTKSNILANVEASIQMLQKQGMYHLTNILVRSRYA
jgi:hypothetical protein